MRGRLATGWPARHADMTAGKRRGAGPVRLILRARAGLASQPTTEAQARPEPAGARVRPRPPGIEEGLAIGGPLQKRKGAVKEDELNDCIDNLVADPTDAEAAIALEVTVDRGADARKVAEAFLMAADQFDPDEVASATTEGE